MEVDKENLCSGSGSIVMYEHGIPKLKPGWKKAMRCWVCNRKLWVKLECIGGECPCMSGNCYANYQWGAALPEHEPGGRKLKAQRRRERELRHRNPK